MAALFEHEGHADRLLVERVHFDLVDGGRDVVEGDDVHQAVVLEIAHADGAQLAAAIRILHGAPGAVHVAEWLVDEEQVQIIELQAPQRLRDGLACALAARILHPRLAGDEQLMP